MRKFKLFLLLGLAKPYSVAEYVIILASYVSVAFVSLLLALHLLYNALVAVGPLPYIKAAPIYYTSVLPLRGLITEFSRVDADLRLEIVKAFANNVIDSSWTVLVTISAAITILLYPILFKISRQLPFMVYRIGVTPLRLYLYSLFLAYIFSFLAPISFILSLIFVLEWSSLPLSALLVSRCIWELFIIVLFSPLAFSSLYLLVKRIDVPLLLLIVLSGFAYMVLSRGWCLFLSPLAYIFVVVFSSILVSKRRWASG